MKCLVLDIIVLLCVGIAIVSIVDLAGVDVPDQDTTCVLPCKIL